MDFGIDDLSPQAPKKPKVNVDVPSLTEAFTYWLRGEIKELTQALARSKRWYDQAKASGDKRQIRQAAADLKETHARYMFLKNRWKDPDKYLTRIFNLNGYESIYGAITIDEIFDRLPFSKVEAEEGLDDDYELVLSPNPYIVGITTPVHFFYRGHWDMGQYAVLVPLGGVVQEIHWIPFDEPSRLARHPHHGVSYTGESNTCFGSFRSSVVLASAEGEYATLLELSSRFVHTYNPSSPLYELPRSARRE